MLCTVIQISQYSKYGKILSEYTHHLQLHAGKYHICPSAVQCHSLAKAPTVAMMTMYSLLFKALSQVISFYGRRGGSVLLTVIVT